MTEIYDWYNSLEATQLKIARELLIVDAEFTVHEEATQEQEAKALTDYLVQENGPDGDWSCTSAEILTVYKEMLANPLEYGYSGE